MILLKKRLHQLFVYIKYWLVRFCAIFYKKPINYWLISERGSDARDNGYVFYKWLKKNHPEVPIKYAITDSSPDRGRVDDADVIRHGTFEHYYAYMNAPMLISTHYQGYSPDYKLFSQLDKRGITHAKGKKVMVDHCIRMGTIGATSRDMPLDLFVCSIHPQYLAFKASCGYKDGVLQDIGMPRFDNLVPHVGEINKHQILFMPTWRVKYTNATESSFMEDEYYKAVKALIESKELVEFLEAQNLDFVFYPHIQMQKFLHLFKTPSERIHIMGAGNAVVEDLLIESQIMITDYSSVFYDFGYMQKPVIYYHFDNEENLKAQKTRWFSFERDGLGPICYTVDEIMACLKNMNLERLEGEYLKRSLDMFQNIAADNCQVVYDKICELR